MMEPLEIAPWPEGVKEKLPVLRSCAFCGAHPYWQPVIMPTDQTVRIHFYHPGTITDGQCILSGMGFSQYEAEGWNRRSTE